MALLKSQDNVSVEKIPDTIRNVMRMYIGMHIDVVTVKFLSTSSSSAQLAIDRVADLHSQMLATKILSEYNRKPCCQSMAEHREESCIIR